MVPGAFSARFDAELRTYEYRIINRAMPLGRRPALRPSRPPPRRPRSRAEAGVGGLIGTHDFAAFCGVKPDRGTTERTVYALEFEQHRDRIMVRIAGLGFLHRMVRISIGTLIEIATGRRPADDIPAILASKDRKRAGYTAPAAGLCLVGVRYGDLRLRASRPLPLAPHVAPPPVMPCAVEARPRSRPLLDIAARSRYTRTVAVPGSEWPSFSCRQIRRNAHLPTDHGRSYA